MSRGPDIRAVAAAALARAETVLVHWLPAGKRKGGEWVSVNPTRTDVHEGSFSVNIATGRWSDFATGDRGGDLVALIAYVENRRQPDAAARLAEFLGLDSGNVTAGDKREKPRATRPQRAQAAKEPAAPALTAIPADALATRPTAHPTHGKPSAEWTYTYAAGAPLFFVLRFDPAEGRKQILPLTWGPGGWEWKGLPPPRPLYNLHVLAARPDAPVLVTEGEKAAAAAAALLPQMVAITSPNGSGSAAKADWAPLKGRRVFVWPDADGPGERYAADVAALALRAGAASVSRLVLAELGELAKGWDAADALAGGWTVERAAALRWEHVGPPRERFEATPQAAPAGEADGIPPGFTLNPDGLFAEMPTKGDGPPRFARVCGALRVLALTRDDHSEGWGRLLVFRDPDGREHTWAAPASLLGGSGEELRRELLRLGLDISTNAECRRLLLDYITRAGPAARARSTARTGWHDGGGAFVLTDRSIGKTTEPVIYAGEMAGPPFEARGTLAEWRERVGALCVGNSRLLFVVSCGFAAPLLSLVGDESGGFHLRGSSTEASSTGKTTALNAAASLFGPREFVEKWRATSNGLEAVAWAHADTLLILDELAQVDAREAGEVAYMLANGAGKVRALRTGDARAVKRWTLLFLSAGEIGLAEHMSAAGKRSRAGQEVRMAEVPADAGAGLGVFEDLHGHADGAAFARALNDASAAHYGTAFPAYVGRLIDHRDGLAARVKELRAKLTAELLDGLERPSGQVHRVAARFALVGIAGELARLYGIVPWPERAAKDAAAACFRAWLAQRQGGAGSAEEAALLAQVRAFFELHGESRFSSFERAERGDDHAPRTSQRAGFVRDTTDQGPIGRVFFVFPEVFRREVVAGYDPREAAAVLVRAGLLRPEGPGRYTRKERIPGFRAAQRVYRCELDHEGAADA